MDLAVGSDGWAVWNGRRLKCALGCGGVKSDKREGDGASPSGSFFMRSVLYRPDREARPVTKLSARALAPADGWCDDPADPAYNQPVLLPYRARAEKLWRADRLYDLVVPLGYNDDPVLPGRGSAIFLHLARDDYGPTEGCIALKRADLLAVLAEADAASRVTIAL
ncbi:MAG: L,D-transpeptidase family protein [Stellaceae bacterium]|jgi:L,D-peptidoglycan transpeptidase YkuD (ErfK/YbiS/YcfS/YnhG family)